MDAIEMALRADEIKESLDTTDSMSDVHDIVESLDTELIKVVLKKYVYAAHGA